MRMPRLFVIVLLALLAAAGCRSRTGPTEAAPEDTTTHLGETADVSAAGWLKLPRADLAHHVEDWVVTVQKYQEEARTQPETLILLPDFRLPIVPLVWNEAHYAPAAGFSLPPYAKAGEHDGALALHLARFGDREAARKLADPADRDLQARIEAVGTERNYPLEWTRLVALALQAAQFKLAAGQPEGATELVVLHRELRQLLDARAAAGPLGAALLSQGREALTQAAAAWKAPKENKTALAQDVEAALADWGDVPTVNPVLVPGASKDEVTGLFQRPVRGKTVAAESPAAVSRALDLLGLPLPPEGAQAVLAFLDEKDHLAELLLVYRPRLNELFPAPADLARRLVEQGAAGQQPSSTPGLNKQGYVHAGLLYEVSLLTRGNAGGALVRVAKDGAAPLASLFPTDPRDFGAANLDRSFEQNRLGLDPRQVGATLEINQKEALARLRQPVPGHPPASARLQREAKEDLLASLTLRWPADLEADALARLAVPLWEAYGAARVLAVEDGQHAFLALHWEGPTTRVVLHLPFDEQPPELTVEDSRGPAALAQRAAAAVEFDHRERLARLADKKAQTRLPRTVSVNGHQLEGLRLGLTRKEVEELLPPATTLRRRPLPDGLNLLVLAEPPATVTHWARQMFLRFSEDRLAEVRIRYQEGPRPAGQHAPSLLEEMKKTAGLPESLPPTWAGLWTDLAAQRPAVMYRWLDDVTAITYQRDPGGIEVIYRDCPPDAPLGIKLPSLEFVGRGTEFCVLGDRREDVRKRWKGVPTSAGNGAEVLPMPATGPYDLLLVWYEDGKVSRLIARHRTKAALKADAVGSALQEAWAAQFDQLGYIRRQDGPHGAVLGGYAWHDDTTRVRIFVQDLDGVPNLFTEWRSWPIAAPAVASK
jgi:hypothetical protein